uniref:Uncharacterized protein n=1 Tax=Lepeophtheirus salmonis TaxID=72036 RepID=A0A0K2T483_LEPSM
MIFILFISTTPFTTYYVQKIDETTERQTNTTSETNKSIPK